MKILLVDSARGGHDESYIRALTETQFECVAVVPENFDSLDCKQVILKKLPGFRKYITWLNEIEKIAQTESPDIIHFTYGDAFYRYAGTGIKNIFRGYKKILTFHAGRGDFVRFYFRKLMAEKFNRVVVHTDAMFNALKNLSVNNIIKIDYPGEMTNRLKISKLEALKRLNISIDKGTKLLIFVGEFRKDRGLDDLLNATKSFKGDFYLIVAGKNIEFSEDYILSKLSGLDNKVKLISKSSYLSNEEFSLYLNATDIIFANHVKGFLGASGPMQEGIAINKMIIGTEEVFGNEINKYHLGLTYRSGDYQDLARAVNKALKIKNFVPDEKYREYQKIILRENFVERHKNLYQEVLNS